EGPTLSAAVDDSRGTVVVSVSGSQHDWENQLLAYDLEARRVIWEKSSDFIPLGAQANRALLGKGTQSTLDRVSDGDELGKIHGTTWVGEDGVALRVRSHEICRWDLDSGHDLWSVDRGIGGTADVVVRRDSVAYLVADGIQRIDVRKGLGWSYTIRASRK